MKDNIKVIESGNKDVLKNFSLEAGVDQDFDCEKSLESEEFVNILKNSSNSYSSNENILYRYYSEVGKHPLLTAEEERKYGLAAREGDMDAWRKLFKGNLRLVIMVAQRYQNQGVELHDLISEGNLGIMHAISKFEPERGFRFSTYAVWWIRHYLSNAIMNDGRTIRIPIHINKAISRMLVVMKTLSQSLQRDPTLNEIALEMGISIAEVMNLMANHESTLSLDSAISRSQDSEGDFYHIVSDESVDNAIDVLMESEECDVLQSMLALLEPQSRSVIEYRFGVNGKQKKTLESTAELLGLTRDQVRYSQTRALETLKEIFDKKGIELTDILS